MGPLDDFSKISLPTSIEGFTSFTEFLAAGSQYSPALSSYSNPTLGNQDGPHAAQGFEFGGSHLTVPAWSSQEPSRRDNASQSDGRGHYDTFAYNMHRSNTADEESQNNGAVYRGSFLNEFNGPETRDLSPTEPTIQAAKLSLAPNQCSAEGTTFICLFEGCEKSFTKQGQLNRHMKDHKIQQALCTEHLCPRSVVGNGFPRKDKLVDHLVRKHKLNRQIANYVIARQRQMPDQRREK